MAEMARQDIYPSVNGYIADLCSVAAAKRAVSEKISCKAEIALAEQLAKLNESLIDGVRKLEKALKNLPAGEQPASQHMAHVVVPQMEEIRALADEMETLTSNDYWPFPKYTDLMYSVR